MAFAYPLLPSSDALIQADVDGDGYGDVLSEFGRAVRYGGPDGLGPVFPLAPDGAVYRDVGDLDGDGFVDLCFTRGSVLECVPGFGRVYGPTFVTLPVTGASVLVDFDGDGDLDIVGQDAGVVWFEQDAMVFTLRTLSNDVVSGWSWDDVNDDGLDDLVGSSSNRPIAFPMLPDGSLGSLLTMSGVSYSSLQFADVNGDGLADALYKPGWVLAHIKRQGQEYNPNYRRLDCLSHFQAVDLDGDGTEDCVSSDFGEPLIWEPSFGGEVFTLGEGGASSLGVSDIDADGHLDVIQFGNASSVTYDPLGAGTVQLLAPRASTLGSAEFDVGDIDGDGYVDVVYSAKDGSIHWLRNVSGLGFESGGTAVEGDGSPDQLHLVDYDGDGHLDVLVLENQLSVFLGDGVGDFTPASSLERPGVVAALPGNFDGDPEVEVVLVRPDGVRLLSEDGSEEVWLEAAMVEPDLQVADIDGDGLDDASVLTGDMFYLFRTNASSPLLTEVQLTQEGSEHVWFDDDGDGFLDAIIAQGFSLQRLVNSGGAYFFMEAYRFGFFAQVATDGSQLVAQTSDSRVAVLGATATDDRLIPSDEEVAEVDLLLRDVSGDGLPDVLGMDGHGQLRVLLQHDRFTGVAPEESTTEPEPTDTEPEPEPTEDQEEAEDVDEPNANTSKPEDQGGCGCRSGELSMSWMLLAGLVGLRR